MKQFIFLILFIFSNNLLAQDYRELKLTSNFSKINILKKQKVSKCLIDFVQDDLSKIHVNGQFEILKSLKEQSNKIELYINDNKNSINFNKNVIVNLKNNKNWCNEKVRKNSINVFTKILNDKIGKQLLNYLDEATNFSEKINSKKTLPLPFFLERSLVNVKYNEVSDTLHFSDEKVIKVYQLPTYLKKSIWFYYFHLRQAGKKDHLVKGREFSNDLGVVNVGKTSSVRPAFYNIGENFIITSRRETNYNSGTKCNWKKRRNVKGHVEQVYFNCLNSTYDSKEQLGFSYYSKDQDHLTSAQKQHVQEIFMYNCKGCSEYGEKLIIDQKQIEDEFIKRAQNDVELLQKFIVAYNSMNLDTKDLHADEIGEKQFKSLVSDIRLELSMLRQIAKRLKLDTPNDVVEFYERSYDASYDKNQRFYKAPKLNIMTEILN